MDPEIGTNVFTIAQMVMNVAAFSGIGIFLYRLGTRLGKSEGKMDVYIEQAGGSAQRLVDLEKKVDGNSGVLDEIVGALRNKKNGIQLSDKR